MIKKVLIAEDHESANISVQKTLEELGISEPDYVYYCDDALSRIQSARKQSDSYDLLITDLHFEEDGKAQKIISGADLISAARDEQPDLKILVFSALSEPATIERLFEVLHVDGYVRKARNDAKELKQAIEQLSRNQRYYPRQLQKLVQNKNIHDFTEFDITVITLLAKGTRQKDIPAYLQSKEIRPSGLSSVEKRLNLMKEVLNITTNEQLVVYCKEMGII